MDITLPYRIFAVDPATGKSGWAVLDLICLDPLKVKIVAHAQIDGDKLLRNKKEMASIFQRQFCIIDALAEEYERLLDLYKPNQTVCEGAYGHTHMNALISLTLATNELRRASKRILNKDIAIVPPTITKMAFTGRGGADKDYMRLAYQTNPYLEGVVADDLISEHEIDAVGHSVGFIKVYITKEIVQLSGKEKRARKRERQLLKQNKLKDK